jgi:hypothetical protein
VRFFGAKVIQTVNVLFPLVAANLEYSIFPASLQLLSCRAGILSRRLPYSSGMEINDLKLATLRRTNNAP